METVKEKDLRPPFVGLSIGGSVLFVRFIEIYVCEMHWMTGALLAGGLAGVLAKIVHTHPIFRKKSTTRFNRTFLLLILLFIFLSTFLLNYKMN